ALFGFGGAGGRGPREVIKAQMRKGFKLKVLLDENRVEENGLYERGATVEEAASA
ncbi:hypothetical protein SK128_024700, partial [Halocaridina rubra]